MSTSPKNKSETKQIATYPPKTHSKQNKNRKPGIEQEIIYESSFDLFCWQT
jgi:hypothetical protein